MITLPDSARALLDSGANGHLVTINRDGSPQLTMIWPSVEGNEVVVPHMRLHQKLRNIRRDGRVVLSVESADVDPIGLHYYLVINGTGYVTEGGCPELLTKLALQRLGPGTSFPPPDTPQGFVLHITPERIGGHGPWVREAKQAE
jgi:PPOX class probable F420-dependent enzyme